MEKNYKTKHIDVDGRIQVYVKHYQPEIVEHHNYGGIKSETKYLLSYNCVDTESALYAAAVHIAEEGLPAQTPVIVHTSWVRVI